MAETQNSDDSVNRWPSRTIAWVKAVHPAYVAGAGIVLVAVVAVAWRFQGQAATEGRIRDIVPDYVGKRDPHDFALRAMLAKGGLGSRLEQHCELGRAVEQRLAFVGELQPIIRQVEEVRSRREYRALVRVSAEAETVDSAYRLIKRLYDELSAVRAIARKAEAEASSALRALRDSGRSPEERLGAFSSPLRGLARQLAEAEKKLRKAASYARSACSSVDTLKRRLGRASSFTTVLASLDRARQYADRARSRISEAREWFRGESEFFGGTDRYFWEARGEAALARAVEDAKEPESVLTAVVAGYADLDGRRGFPYARANWNAMRTGTRAKHVYSILYAKEIQSWSRRRALVMVFWGLLGALLVVSIFRVRKMLATRSRGLRISVVTSLVCGAVLSLAVAGSSLGFFGVLETAGKGAKMLTELESPSDYETRLVESHRRWCPEFWSDKPVAMANLSDEPRAGSRPIRAETPSDARSLDETEPPVGLTDGQKALDRFAGAIAKHDARAFRAAVTADGEFGEDPFSGPDGEVAKLLERGTREGHLPIRIRILEPRQNGRFRVRETYTDGRVAEGAEYELKVVGGHLKVHREYGRNRKFVGRQRAPKATAADTSVATPEASEQPRAGKCSGCKRDFPANARFCPNCGAKVAASTTRPSARQPTRRPRGPAFSQDFGTDPAFRSDSPKELYWDSRSHNYRVGSRDVTSGVGRYTAWSPTFPRLSGGFVFTCDIYTEKACWGNYPGVHFVDSRTATPYAKAPLRLRYVWSDGRVRLFNLNDSKGHSLWSPTARDRSWYRVTVRYDNVRKTASWEIRDLGKNTVFHSASNLPFTVSPFDGLVLGEVTNPPKYGTHAVIRVDNIELRSTSPTDGKGKADRADVP